MRNRRCGRFSQTFRVDLIILDVMLPGKDGLTICRELRATKAIPIIMLTSRGEPMDRIVGLEMGADDYLPKPFEVRELEARVKAILRRSEASFSSADTDRSFGARFTFAGWTLDARLRQLFSPQNVLVDLTSGELDLLLVFAERPQRVLSRDQLMDLARGREATVFDRASTSRLADCEGRLKATPRRRS